jgi:hypothetical protein
MNPHNFFAELKRRSVYKAPHGRFLRRIQRDIDLAEARLQRRAT